MKYVYELRDSGSSVVHVGQSKDPERRLYQHTKSNSKGSGHGKFYGRTDITMDVVAGPMSEPEARDLEEQLQIQYGLVTDREKSKQNGRNTTALVAAKNARATVSKFTIEQAEVIRDRWHEEFQHLSMRQFTIMVADETGVSSNSIANILHGVTYRPSDYVDL